MNISHQHDHQIEQSVEKALAALKRYKHEQYDRHLIHQSIPELLYEMLGHVFFRDKVLHYEQDIVTLLSILLKPDVTHILQKELTPMLRDELSEMLLALYHFLRCIKEEYYLLQLEMVGIELCTDLERLKSIEATYQTKLMGCLSEQHSRKLKNMPGCHLKPVENERG